MIFKKFISTWWAVFLCVGFYFIPWDFQIYIRFSLLLFQLWHCIEQYVIVFVEYIRYLVCLHLCNSICVHTVHFLPVLFYSILLACFPSMKRFPPTMPPVVPAHFPVIVKVRFVCKAPSPLLGSGEYIIHLLCHI